MLVEVLTFDGCPHATGALELAQTATADLDENTEVRVVNVPEQETGAARFLGSPTIRVNGQDIEPGAEARLDYAYSCRLYVTAGGRSPLPDEAWLRKALTDGVDT